MEQELLARLEKLVDRLLEERVWLQEQNRQLTIEKARLVDDRSRVSAELAVLLEKLDRLHGGNR